MNFEDKDWKAQAIDNLDTSRRILDDLKVPYFLSNGTLIGCIRDGDLIPHDSDIDLGIFIEDYRVDILQAFLDKGFVIHGIFGTPENGLEYSLRRKVKLDIFFYYKEPDGKRSMSVFSGSQIKYIYPDFKTIPYNFIGEPFMIPDNYEAYLTAQYGDWRTPVKEWNYAKDPHNLKQNNG